ncbi:MAG TPA: hypothetical protein VEY09_07180 [Pyrinomonadaceae bacterium]|nr:hypothetical protein [Pyrinomonadaceae bacterium]
MRLSEFVIIYLAAAAPFGVAHVLRSRGRNTTRTRAYAKAMAAALAWPLWLALRAPRPARDECEGGGRPRALDDSLVRRAERETIVALRRAEDAFFVPGRTTDDEARHRFFAARECAERYAGLALACDGARAEERPSEREMELCRIAGRGGDDLLLAGRCIHRRNVTRLLAHRERARAEFEAALVSLCSAAGASSPGPTGEPRGGPVDALCAELAAALAGAATLFSALGDAEAAARARRLLTEVRASRAEPDPGARTDDETDDPTRTGRPCTTEAAHAAFAGPPPSATTLTRR